MPTLVDPFQAAPPLPDRDVVDLVSSRHQRLVEGEIKRDAGRGGEHVGVYDREASGRGLIHEDDLGRGGTVTDREGAGANASVGGQSRAHHNRDLASSVIAGEG